MIASSLVHNNGPAWVIGIVVAVVWVVLVLVRFVIAKRRAAPRGHPPIVRCSKGHVFTTVWIPGGSFKAVRWLDPIPALPGRQAWNIGQTHQRRRLSDEERQSARSTATQFPESSHSVAVWSCASRPSAHRTVVERRSNNSRTR